MQCPFCDSANTRVVDKRDNNEINVTRRRRECEKCEKRFTTYERIEAINLYVVKRSGKIEEFDREKLKRGILKAIGKRGVSELQVEELVQAVEQHLLNHETTEITSREVGDLVLEKLKDLDELSYLVFASVYRDFKSLADFKKAIAKLEVKPETA